MSRDRSRIAHNVRYGRLMPNPIEGLPGAERDTDPTEDARGWVSWKGTTVCLNLYCSCGSHEHVDADFAYYVRCRACGATYYLSPHVRLVELTADEASTLDRRVVMEPDDEWDGGRWK